MKLRKQTRDSSTLRLPAVQDALLQAVAATGKPIVVVLLSGAVATDCKNGPAGFFIDRSLFIRRATALGCGARRGIGIFSWLLQTLKCDYFKIKPSKIVLRRLILPLGKFTIHNLGDTKDDNRAADHFCDVDTYAFFVYHWSLAIRYCCADSFVNCDFDRDYSCKPNVYWF
jgi:hypothetical protein